MIEPEIILGPPGTGKTTSLLRIVEEELESGTLPNKIAYVSFTKRAATEAITRACDKFKFDRKELPYFKTLHSLCFHFLGLSRSDMLTKDSLKEFGSVVGYDIRGSFSLEDGTIYGQEKGDRLLFMDNLARIRQQPLRELYDEDDDDLSFNEVDRFSRALVEYKRDTGLIDYTDLLEMFVKTQAGPELDVLLVDEAQDLSLLQWLVVQKLARRCRRVIYAGDDDQAIYRWAGADVDMFVDMPGQVRVLNKSWRVPSAVQNLATEVVSRIRHRRPKDWSPREDGGVVKFHPAGDTVDVSSGDILVLGRNRYILSNFEDKIRSAGYLYSFHDNPSIAPSTLEAVLTWERLRKGRSGVYVTSVRKMYEKMTMNVGWKRGFKELRDFDGDEEVTIDILQKAGGLLCDPNKLWYDALDKLHMREVAYIRATLRRGEDLTKPPRIRLSTIHGMKGGEASQVILLTDMAERTFKEYRANPEDEARVWYVAATRAKEELHVVAPRTPRHYKF